MNSTATYLVNRVLITIPVVVGVCAIAFTLMYLLPGDPASAMLARSGASAAQIAELRADMGLDAAFHIQFMRYVTHLMQGDLGRSIVSQEPVLHLLLSRLPTTLALIFSALVIAVPVGTLFGVIAAVNKGRWIDRTLVFVASIGVSVPSFWFGLMLILVFSVYLNWLPAFGTDGVLHLILPASVLAFNAIGTVTRTARTSMLDVLHQDYIVTARAKGLTERTILYRHALRNALVPVVTIIGLQFGWLVSGSFIIEAVFSRQGIGQLFINSILERDFPVVQGGVLLTAVMYVVLNLIVDLLYVVVDPRIRYD